MHLRSNSDEAEKPDRQFDGVSINWANPLELPSCQRLRTLGEKDLCLRL